MDFESRLTEGFSTFQTLFPILLAYSLREWQEYSFINRYTFSSRHGCQETDAPPSSDDSRQECLVD